MTDVWNSYGPSAAAATFPPPARRASRWTCIPCRRAGGSEDRRGDLDISTIPLARYGTPETKELKPQAGRGSPLAHERV